MTDSLAAAFAPLIPQLSPSSSPPPRPHPVAGHGGVGGASCSYGPGRDGRILGPLTLAVFRKPTGLRAWIEDVVVDGAPRGIGVGEALCQAAVAGPGHTGPGPST